jgi:hypothetical protein
MAFLQRSKENTKDGAVLFMFIDWRHLFGLMTASREVGLAKLVRRFAFLQVLSPASSAIDKTDGCQHDNSSRPIKDSPLF